jgi:hypothetical protein
MNVRIINWENGKQIEHAEWWALVSVVLCSASTEFVKSNTKSLIADQGVYSVCIKIFLMKISFTVV